MQFFPIPDAHKPSAITPADIKKRIIQFGDVKLFSAVERLWKGDYVRKGSYRRELSYWCHCISDNEKMLNQKSQTSFSFKDKNYNFFIKLGESIILDKKNISAKISIRFGLIVTSAIAIIIALYFTYAVDIWYIVGSFTVPALLIPLILALYSIRIHNPFLCMILPSTISILWYIYGLTNSIGGYPNYLLNLDPMYPGVISSFILCYLFSEKGVFR